MKKQRIHCFAGRQYYPSGGMADYVGSFETTDDAMDYLRGLENQPDWASFAWLDDAGNLTFCAAFERDWPSNDGTGTDTLKQVIEPEEWYRRSVTFALKK